MPIADINGIHLNYISEGAGIPLVLLTGFGGDINFWKRTSTKLSTTYTVIRVDNRGVGSTNCKNDFSIDDMSDDIVSLLEHLGHPKAHIVGWSMGSHIAQNIAIRHQKNVISLTLISSYRKRPARSMYILRGAVETVKSGAPMECLARTINGLCYTESFFEDMEKKDSIIRLPELDGIDGLQAQLDAVDGHDTTCSASRIRCPTLSIHGIDDIMVECSEGDALADSIEGCRILRIEGVGHLINPDLYLYDLIKHLKDHE